MFASAVWRGRSAYWSSRETRGAQGGIMAGNGPMGSTFNDAIIGLEPESFAIIVIVPSLKAGRIDGWRKSNLLNMMGLPFCWKVSISHPKIVVAFLLFCDSKSGLARWPSVSLARCYRNWIGHLVFVLATLLYELKCWICRKSMHFFSRHNAHVWISHTGQ